jgi:putative transposase
MGKQLEMKLPTWGGKRKRAGRKPKGSRAGVPHVARYLPKRTPAHVTMKIAEGLPSLRSSRRFAIVRAALAAGKERFGFRIIHFSVQGNHLHLLVEAEDAAALTRGVKGIAVRIARPLNLLEKRRGTVFPDRFHSRALRSPREVSHVLRYVLRNNERHGGRPGIDPFCSAGLARPEEVVAGPRTWLVRIVLEREGVAVHFADAPAGWRRSRHPS